MEMTLLNNMMRDKGKLYNAFKGTVIGMYAIFPNGAINLVIPESECKCS